MYTYHTRSFTDFYNATEMHPKVFESQWKGKGLPKGTQAKVNLYCWWKKTWSIIIAFHNYNQIKKSLLFTFLSLVRPYYCRSYNGMAERCAIECSCCTRPFVKVKKKWFIFLPVLRAYDYVLLRYDRKKLSKYIQEKRRSALIQQHG